MFFFTEHQVEIELNCDGVTDNQWSMKFVMDIQSVNEVQLKMHNSIMTNENEQCNRQINTLVDVYYNISCEIIIMEIVCFFSFLALEMHKFSCILLTANLFVFIWFDRISICGSHALVSQFLSIVFFLTKFLMPF